MKMAGDNTYEVKCEPNSSHIANVQNILPRLNSIVYLSSFFAQTGDVTFHVKGKSFIYT